MTKTPSLSTPLRRHFSSSEELRGYVSERSGGDTCLLSFSLGKDSIVAWVALRPHFKRIVPFFFYLIPDLEFVEQGLRYFEDKFQTPIIRLPHPSLYRMLHALTFQPPERCLVIETAIREGRLAKFEYQELEEHVRRVSAAPEAFVAVGTRTADSPIRLANLRQHGAIHPRRRSFWAVFDWKIADVEACLVREGLKLPVDYKMFGRSFDGVDFRFLDPIRRNFPRDYEKILSWFPLAELEIKRREWAAKEPHAEEASKA